VLCIVGYLEPNEIEEEILKLILYAILVSTHYFTSNGMNIDAKPKKEANPTTSVTVVRKIDED